ncbi:MAG: C_GCAxxG_C_C family protein [Dehalococcoidia bacterium]|nr:C_GCAxxG_C_C family protein [Dehalococcoidia bacterium]
MAQRGSREDLIEQARNKAYEYESQYHGCSQAVLLALQQVFGLEDETVFRAAGPFCAGLGAGKTCGALAGGAMFLGLKHGRSSIKEGLSGLLPGMLIVQMLVDKFQQEFGTTVCQEISGIDWTNPEAVVLAVSNPEFIEKCATTSGKTAAMAAELMTEA